MSSKKGYWIHPIEMYLEERGTDYFLDKDMGCQ